MLTKRAARIALAAFWGSWALWYARNCTDPHTLVTTKPHFGGLRWWFICPGLRCGGKRVAKLYRPPNGDLFLCRECYEITHRSSQEHDKTMDTYQRMPWDQLVALLHGEDAANSLDQMRGGNRGSRSALGAVTLLANI